MGSAQRNTPLQVRRSSESGGRAAGHVRQPRWTCLARLPARPQPSGRGKVAVVGQRRGRANTANETRRGSSAYTVSMPAQNTAWPSCVLWLCSRPSETSAAHCANQAHAFQVSGPAHNGRASINLAARCQACENENFSHILEAAFTRNTRSLRPVASSHRHRQTYRASPSMGGFRRVMHQLIRECCLWLREPRHCGRTYLA